MYRCRTISKSILCFFLLLLMPSAVHADNAAFLCPEGCYLELSGGYGGQIDVYSAAGEWRCGFQAYMEIGSPVYVYEGKLRGISSVQGTFLNLETGKNIGPFPSEQYHAEVQGDYLVVRSLEQPGIEIYDADGSVIAQFPDAESVYCWMLGDELYTLMQEGRDITVHRYDPSSGELSDINGACFQDADIMEFREIRYLGDNYLISGNGWNRVVTKDWEVLYRCEGNTFIPYSGILDNRYSSVRTETTEYFQEKTAADGVETVNVLDRNLDTVLSMTADDWWAKMPKYEGGYLTCAPCEELNGRICTGIMGTDWKHIPYNREGSTCYYSLDGELRSIELPEAFSPTGVNSRYMTVWDNRDQMARLLDLQTGTDVVLPETPDGARFELGENSVMVRGSRVSTVGGTPAESDYCVLYDNDFHEITRAEGYWSITQWAPGMWYYKNNLSDGIIDESGHWLLRRWNVRD